MTAGRQFGAARSGPAAFWPPLAKLHFRFHFLSPRSISANLTPLDAFCRQVRNDGLLCGIAIDRGDSPGVETLRDETRERATQGNKAKTGAAALGRDIFVEKDVPSANHGTQDPKPPFESHHVMYLDGLRRGFTVVGHSVPALDAAPYWTAEAHLRDFWYTSLLRAP